MCAYVVYNIVVNIKCWCLWAHASITFICVVKFVVYSSAGTMWDGCYFCIREKMLCIWMLFRSFCSFQTEKVSVKMIRALAKQHILDWILLCILFIDLILFFFLSHSLELYMSHCACSTFRWFGAILIPNSVAISVRQCQMLVFTLTPAFLSREIINKCVK